MKRGVGRAAVGVGLIGMLGVMSLGVGCSCDRCGSCAADSGSRLAYMTTPEMEARDAPYSEAVRVGDLLFLSGRLGFDPAIGALAPGGIGPETRRTLEGIREVLERRGSGMDRVVKCTVFLADVGEWGQMNEVYREFFPSGARPARSAVGVGGLPLGARVEIECIALAGD